MSATALHVVPLETGAWQLPAPGIALDGDRLRLAGSGRAPHSSAPATAWAALADSPGRCGDPAGGWLALADDGAPWRVGGGGPGSLAADDPALRRLPIPAEAELRDVACDGRDLLLILVARAEGAAVIVHDPRGRYRDETLALGPVTADRLAPLATGAWLVDRSSGARHRLLGVPRHVGYDTLPSPSDGTLRPCPVDPDPLRLVAAPPLPGPVLAVAGLTAGSWPALGTAVLAALVGDPATAEPLRLVLAGDHLRQQPIELALPEGVRPATLAPAGVGRLAGFVPGADTAAVLALEPGSPTTRLVAEPHPMPDWDGGRPLNDAPLPCGPARYRDRSGRLRALVPLAQRRLAPRATVTAQPLDGGDPDSCWDRLVVEARVPEGCGLTAWLGVAPSAEEPTAWQPHRIAGPVLDADRPPAERMPVAAWSRQPSERPFEASLVPGPHRPLADGTFEVLIQRPGVAVRDLRGRFLHLRLEFTGPGHRGPDVHAVRVYRGRQDWRDLLPVVYRETVVGSAADAPGPATGADWYGRFLQLFAGELRSWHERVAASWRLTDPHTAPAAALPWLATWVRQGLDGDLPEHRARRQIAEAVPLARQRGTAAGLRRALDIVSGGLQGAGQLVLVEEWQLHRIAGTVLGWRDDGRDDPLIPGGRRQSNSIVGRNLVLADGFAAEFRALFLAGDASAWRAHLAERSHRIAVLVHGGVPAAERARLVRCLERECPAHVQWRLLAASEPFLIGIRSLLGIDTVVGRHLPPEPVVVGSTRVGDGDRIVGAARLDPRSSDREALS